MYGKSLKRDNVVSCGLINLHNLCKQKKCWYADHLLPSIGSPQATLLLTSRTDSICGSLASVGIAATNKRATVGASVAIDPSAMKFDASFVI